MSASHGGRVRRRIPLLAGSALVAAFGGLAFVPTTANAQATCTAPAAPAGNGTNAVTISAGAQNPGITCTYAGTAATITTAGSISVSTAAGGNGVNLSATGASAVNWVSTAGTVTGGANTNGPIIEAMSVSGPINITTAAMTGSAATVTYGVNAVSTGGGAVTVTNTTGNVNISSATTGIAAIRAVSTGGSGAVSITTTGTVTGRQYGIQGQASGSGALTITANNAVNTNATAGLANIDATTGTGLLTINLGGAISGMNGNLGAAIKTNAGGDQTINIADGRSLQSGTGSAATLDLTGAGLAVVANAGQLSGQATYIIRAAGGSFRLDNTGRMTGRVDLAAMTGNATVNNELNWSTIGTSAFGGESLIINTGQLIITGSTTFTGLDSFENSGTITFGNNRIETGFILSAPGTAFDGADGLLELEAILDGTSQAGCGTAAVADCLSLAGGSTSGVTRIGITVLGATTTDANSSITLVDVGGGTSQAGDFVLDSSSTNYALDTVYDSILMTPGVSALALLYDQTTQRHNLVSVMPGQRLDYLATGQEVLSVWHTTSDTVAARQADLRDGGSHGFWLRAAGENTTRDLDTAFTAGSAPFQHADEYELQTATVIGGLDLTAFSNESGVFAAGVHGGVVRSTLERQSSATVDEMDGAVAGLYGGWSGANGLTLDAAFIANFLQLEQDTILDDISSTNVVSAGVRGEAGWRHGLSQGFYVQPLVSASYVHANIKEVFMTGFSASYENLDSFRGGLGLRVGGGADTGLGKLGYWVSGHAWKEFAGEGALVLTTSAERVAIQDDLIGEFQELVAGVSLTSSSGNLQGYVSGGAKFADDSDGHHASVGIRLRW